MHIICRGRRRMCAPVMSTLNDLTTNVCANRDIGIGRERGRYGRRHVDGVTQAQRRYGIMRTGNSTVAQRERRRENIIIKLLSIALLLLRNSK